MSSTTAARHGSFRPAEGNGRAGSQQGTQPHLGQAVVVDLVWVHAARMCFTLLLVVPP